MPDSDGLGVSEVVDLAEPVVLLRAGRGPARAVASRPGRPSPETEAITLVTIKVYVSCSSTRGGLAAMAAVFDLQGVDAKVRRQLIKCRR